MITIAVCLPTRGRAQQLLENVSGLIYQVFPVQMRLLVVLAIPVDDRLTVDVAVELRRMCQIRRKEGRHGDLPLQGDIEIVQVMRMAGSTAVEGWNEAYWYAEKDGADWYFLGADDIRWRPGWAKEALRAARETGAEVVGLSDGGFTDLSNYAPHYLASRQFLAEQVGGYLAPPMYKAWWFDREICEKAAALGVYAPAPEAVAEHRHPDWGQAVDDDTYRRGRRHHNEDQHFYERRKAAGFPLDYPTAGGHRPNKFGSRPNAGSSFLQGEAGSPSDQLHPKGQAQAEQELPLQEKL